MIGQWSHAGEAAVANRINLEQGKCSIYFNIYIYKCIYKYIYIYTYNICFLTINNLYLFIFLLFFIYFCTFLTSESVSNYTCTVGTARQAGLLRWSEQRATTIHLRQRRFRNCVSLIIFSRFQGQLRHRETIFLWWFDVIWYYVSPICAWSHNCRSCGTAAPAEPGWL